MKTTTMFGDGQNNDNDPLLSEVERKHNTHNHRHKHCRCRCKKHRKMQEEKQGERQENGEPSCKKGERKECRKKCKTVCARKVEAKFKAMFEEEMEPVKTDYFNRGIEELEKAKKELEEQSLQKMEQMQKRVDELTEQVVELRAKNSTLEMVNSAQWGRNVTLSAQNRDLKQYLATIEQIVMAQTDDVATDQTLSSTKAGEAAEDPDPVKKEIDEAAAEVNGGVVDMEIEEESGEATMAGKEQEQHYEGPKAKESGSSQKWAADIWPPRPPNWHSGFRLHHHRAPYHLLMHNQPPFPHPPRPHLPYGPPHPFGGPQAFHNFNGRHYY